MKALKILLASALVLIFNIALVACVGNTPDEDRQPVHQHTIVIDEAVAATCVSTGLTEGAHCSECDEIIVAQTTISENDSHSFENYICKHCGAIDENNISYSEGLKYKINDDGTCSITGIGSCADTNLYIPSYIDGHKVTSIGNGAFYGCSTLTSVAISDGVLNIGNGAFLYCYSLTTIIIPDSIVSIGGSAFFGCNSLERIIVEKGNTIYHSVGDCLIETASKTLIVCKNGVIPADGSVTNIGGGAFIGGDSITDIVIPDGVTSIGEGAFGGCSSLTSIVLPNSITSIGKNAFDGCGSLTNIVIPDSVISIGDYAFEQCGLTSIIIPKSVVYIGASPFYACDNMESIVVEKGNFVYHSTNNCLIETASKTLISGCKNSIIPADGTVTSIKNQAFSYCRDLKSIIISDGITSIGNAAFFGCSNLTVVVIPDSVTSIGYNAFGDCDSLESITVPFIGATKDGTSNTHLGYWFGAIDFNGSLGYTYNSTAVPTSLKTVIVTGGSSIGEGAFFGCSDLTNIVIPDSVVSIGDYAFSNCSGITSIVIPNGVTSIGDRTFTNCNNLTIIIMSSGLASIGDDAFYGCGNLTSIIFEGTKDQWSNIVKWSMWDYDTGDYIVYCTDGTVGK